MIKRLSSTGILMLALTQFSTQAAADFGDPERILLQRGDVVITEYDLMQYAKERIPESHRVMTLATHPHMRQLLENLYLIRWYANEARANTEVDEAFLRWQASFYSDRKLMDDYINDRIENMVAGVDWEQTIEEAYIAQEDRLVGDERVRAAHILIGMDERSEEEAHALAQSLLERLQQGEDFAELAAEYSKDPSGEANGGKLGTFGRGQMVPEFERAVFAMREPGQLSDLVRTQFGYHIIKVTGKR